MYSKIHTTAILLLALATPVLAGPIQKENIPADAKWLLHWDLEKYRSTEVGRYFDREILAKKLEKPRADLKQYFNIDLDWEKFTSLTACGTDFEPQNGTNALLIVKTDLTTANSTEMALIKQVDYAKSHGGPIEAITAGPFGTYSINNNVFVSFQKGGRILLGKSLAQVRKAIEIIQGKSANLTTSTALNGFPAGDSDFFFIALAEGFADRIPLPPNAKILQTTEGVRAVLREKSDKLSLSLTLKAKSADSCKQMQQVVQGMIALVNLSQQENKDLMLLAQSASVTTEDRSVSLGLDYPVKEAIAKLSEIARNEQFKISAKQAENSEKQPAKNN
jgi:hypothetical protein